jgi:opacity protein-like surface antigen
VRSFERLLLGAVLVALSAAPALADGFISPFAGYNFGGDSANCISATSCEEKRLNWGVSLGTSGGVLGFEEEFSNAPAFFGSTPGGENGVLTLMSNVLIVIPAGPIQPYVLGGLGLIRSHAKLDASSLSLDKNSLGYDLGGGLTVYLSHAFGIRGDVRHFRTLQDVTLGVLGNDQIDFWRASAGLTLRF